MCCIMAKNYVQSADRYRGRAFILHCCPKMAASTNRKTMPGFYQQLKESVNWFLEPVKTKKKGKKGQVAPIMQ